MAAVKSPHSGQWSSGQSGNPGGRPRKTPEQRSAEGVAKKHSPEMIDILYGVAVDPAQPVKERREAARDVLAYGVGLPVNRVLQATVGNQGAITDNTGIDEVAQRLRLIYERTEKPIVTENLQMDDT